MAKRTWTLAQGDYENPIATFTLAHARDKGVTEMLRELVEAAKQCPRNDFMETAAVIECERCSPWNNDIYSRIELWHERDNGWCIWREYSMETVNIPDIDDTDAVVKLLRQEYLLDCRDGVQWQRDHEVDPLGIDQWQVVRDPPN